MRGLGWGKKHSTVDYVWNYSWTFLVAYHMLVIREMEKRGWHVDPLWKNPGYRRKKCKSRIFLDTVAIWGTIYPEHDDKYLEECLENLKNKGVKLPVSSLSVPPRKK